MYDISFTSLSLVAQTINRNEGDDRDLCPYNLLKCIKLHGRFGGPF